MPIALPFRLPVSLLRRARSPRLGLHTVCAGLAAAVLAAIPVTPRAQEAVDARPAGGLTGAQVLRLGNIDFRACEVGAAHASGLPTQDAYCARFDVPEDWDTPAGRHIGLRVAIVRSAVPEPDKDLVVFLDGGPGGAATEDYPAIAPAMAQLRKRHHILLIDQRGTGGSNPLGCDEELALETDKPAPIAASGTDADPARQLALVHHCLDALARRAAPQFYATSDAVADLEAVRHALGDAPLDLLGISYGTRVAQQYAARHPNAVRSIVLDSPVPNRLALLTDHARNLEDVIQRRLAQCQADPACAGRFGDSYGQLHQVHAQLRRKPQSVAFRDPQTFAWARRNFGADDLAALVRFYLYGAPTSALLPYVIAQAHDGQWDALMAQVQFVVGDISERMSRGMAASVLCSEDADLLRERGEDEATLLGNGPIRSAIQTCKVWPHRPRPADFHEPLKTDLPVLVLAGEFDPVTPPRYGSEIIAGLPHARMLLARGQGHAVLGVGCMSKLVADFIAHPDPAALDDHCLQALGQTPAFLDVNGSSP